MKDITAHDHTDSQLTKREHHSSQSTTSTARVPQSPSIELPSTSGYSSATTNFAPSMTSTSPSTSKEVDNENDEKPTMSRRKQLLAKRQGLKQIVLGARRRRLLEEAKEKARKSEYEATRLSSRLEILHLFVDQALVDDAFLARKEMNPWRFKSPNMTRKYNFVNSMVTAGEMLVLVQDAKERARNKEKEASQKQSEKEEEEKKDIADDVTILPKTEEMAENTGDEDHVQSAFSTSGTTEDNQEKKRKQNVTRRQKAIVKLRNCKSSKAGSCRSGHTLYAFGSTHNKETCHYCGILQCDDPLNQSGDVKGKHSNVLGERIIDVHGIYNRESYRSKYSKKIQDRTNVIDDDVNEKRDDSRLSVHKNIQKHKPRLSVISKHSKT